MEVYCHAAPLSDIRQAPQYSDIPGHLVVPITLSSPPSSSSSSAVEAMTMFSALLPKAIRRSGEFPLETLSNAEKRVYMHEDIHSMCNFYEKIREISHLD